MSRLLFGLLARLHAPDPGDNPPSPSPSPAPRPEVFGAEYVRELREENKGWRLKASEQEAAAKAAKEAAEKATADAAETLKTGTKAANDAANARIIRAELKASAMKAGMVDLDGLKLADLSKVTLDEKGEVQGADALMEQLKKDKPYLFGAASTSGGTPPKPGDPKTKTAAEMTDVEYAAAKAAMLKKK